MINSTNNIFDRHNIKTRNMAELSLQYLFQILQCFIELKQYRRVVASCLLSNYRPDFLKMLKDVETNKSKLEAIKFALALAGNYSY